MEPWKSMDKVLLKLTRAQLYKIKPTTKMFLYKDKFLQEDCLHAECAGQPYLMYENAEPLLADQATDTQTQVHKKMHEPTHVSMAN